MKKSVSKFPSFFFAGLLLMGAAPAMAQGTVVFDSIPSPTPPNVISEGFQCCQNAELGDEVRLEADTPRRTGFTTVLMSSWSLHSNYPTMAAAGYTHPITLNIYADAASRRRAPTCRLSPGLPVRGGSRPGGLHERQTVLQRLRVHVTFDHGVN